MKNQQMRYKSMKNKMRMRMKKLLFAIILLIPLSGAFAADMTSSTQIVSNQLQYDHAVWNGMPLSFNVPVGQERILKFPSAVTLHNSNASLTTDKVNILNNAGFLYIRAKKAFDPIRIPILIKQTGKVVLIDLSAKQGGSDMPVSIVLPSQESQGSQEKQVSRKRSSDINYVSLMRFAIQHLYAPNRLMENQGNITRTPMYTHKNVNLFNNGNVMAMPLISWRGGNLYVTAILLKNTWKHRVVLDPRNINGHWLAASFYPSNFVMPIDNKHDRTTLFLVSDEPFNNALNQIKGYSQ